MNKTRQFEVVPLEEVLKTAVPIDEPELPDILPEPAPAGVVVETQLEEEGRGQI
jgi:hypothetical protein